MKKVLFITLLALAVTSLFLLMLNKKEVSKNNPEKISVVTTLFPFYDFVKNIGGDKVNISMLLPPGAEAHGFEPKPSDIVKINEADVFIYTSDFMEPWAKDILNGVDSEKSMKIVDSSIGVELIHTNAQKEDHDVKESHPEHEHSDIDPHIWLNFDNSKIIIDNIANALIEKDFKNTDFYKKNAEIYKTKLSELDSRYEAELSKCRNKKIIYGGHYAFGYMENKYGLTYKSAYGISPNSEPSAKDLIVLTQQIVQDDIKYIFFEELLSPRVAETLSRETGADLLILNPAHNLTKKDFENNVSFLSVMEENLDNLKIGLQCNK